MKALVEPIVVAELLPIQEGAVVSREIVRNTGGTVTFFAFDKGEGLSEHTAPFDALVQVVSGEAAIVVSGKEHALHSGQLLLMSATQPHSVKAVTPMKMLLTMIRSSEA